MREISPSEKKTGRTTFFLGATIEDLLLPGKNIARDLDD
jgi:hypothetical protein